MMKSEPSSAFAMSTSYDIDVAGAIHEFSARSSTTTMSPCTVD